MKTHEDFSKYNGEGTILRKAQLRMLDMLIEVDKICRKHNIQYWLDFGTLLGAVRHQGFIPWDDDVDISILKSDYNKLREVLLRELPDQFVFTDWMTDNFIFAHYGRVRDTQSFYPYPLFKKQKEQGLWLDIFVVEKIPSMRIKRFVDFFYGRSFREIHHYGDVLYKSKSKKYFIRTIAYLAHPISLLLVWNSRLLAMFKKSDLLGFTYSDNNTTAHYPSDIFPTKEILFEGHKFFAPCNVDIYLKAIYGNYMEIPDEKKRQPVSDVSTIVIK